MIDSHIDSEQDEFIPKADHTHVGTIADLKSDNNPNGLRLTFALAGNQNSGKTTLFNYLTGSNQHVGNWPGVTVEKKTGKVKKYPGITLVDLPGIYSLSPYTDEEMITRNYLLDEKPDAIINIVDANNLERNLYLTLQLAELGIPMVIALNMMDEIAANGDVIDVDGLERDLGIPVVPIVARNGSGVEDLIRRAIGVAMHREQPPIRDICEGEVHKAIHSIGHIIEPKARARGYSARFVSTKLIEGEDPIKQAIGLTPEEEKIIDEIISEMEKATGLDREAAIADSRYRFITKVCSENFKRRRKIGEQSASDKIDKVLTGKYSALPIFLAIMLFVFWLTFGPIGSRLSEGFSELIDTGIGIVDHALMYAGVSEWLQSLVVDGILGGVGSVLNFLPVILILFICLSVLEDCGYMARAAFIMDRLLRKIGLSGRSFIPFMMGFGCTVPALMATRTLENKRIRYLTVLLTPFMSCGAKVPVYTLFIAAFFAKGKILVIFSLYLIGILVAVLMGLILKSTLFRGTPAPFIIELPPYRWPAPHNVAIQVWEKIKDFLERAVTIILLATVVIWFLGSFDPKFYWTADSSQSILAMLGGLFAPLFLPLGFGNWQAITSLVSGFMAKESIISTMAVVYKAADQGLQTVLQSIFTPASAFSFLIFVLLYPPCIASVSTMNKEVGTKWTGFAIVLELATAWIVSFLAYHIALLIL
ncbi:MAG TPA: ferrous iron transport protein B [Flexilinea sp.]|nr:ferrous iron transport protein B [Flexilinea sp.]